MSVASTTRRHGHFWLAATAGVAAGLVLLIWAPSQPAISGSLFLFAGFHVLGGIVTLVSLWQLAPARRKARQEFDFGATGRGPAMLMVAALALVGIGALILTLAPAFAPLAALAFVQAGVSITGSFALHEIGRVDAATLPLIALPNGAQDAALVLGCGAGRATIALAKVWRGGRLLAMDRFAPETRARLERNLALAGCAAKVEIVSDDSRAAAEDGYRLIIAAHVFDHARGRERDELQAARRRLAEDGRLVATLFTPNFALFSVVSLAAYTFRGKAAWRRLLAQERFVIEREFHVNSGWGVVARKDADR